jgi:AcrR family transcriptional regulator
MARMTRLEGRQQTRDRLLAAARELFEAQGYGATSVDAIAAAAGYSKGAVYSNFDGKEAILMAVLERSGRGDIDFLLDEIGRAEGREAVIGLLAGWADARSTGGNLVLTMLEHARQVGPGAPSLVLQEQILKGCWRDLGEALLARFPGMAEDPEILGALLHEIVYAPALPLVGRPTAGDLMRFALERLLPR